MSDFKFKKGDKVVRTSVQQVLEDVEQGAEYTVANVLEPWIGLEGVFDGDPIYMGWHFEKVEPDPVDAVVLDHIDELEPFSWEQFAEDAIDEAWEWDEDEFELNGRHVARITESGNRIVDPEEGWDLVTSAIAGDAHTYGKRHRLVLDLDYEARLIPSTSEGHFHLYLDGVEISDTGFREVLWVLAKHGLIQPGYREHSLDAGYSSVRAPWIRKEEGDGGYDPDAEKAARLARWFF